MNCTRTAIPATQDKSEGKLAHCRTQQYSAGVAQDSGRVF